MAHNSKWNDVEEVLYMVVLLSWKYYEYILLFVNEFTRTDGGQGMHGEQGET